MRSFFETSGTPTPLTATQLEARRGDPMAALELARLKPEVARNSREMLCYLTQLQDQNLVVPALEFYVFVCAWLLQLGIPTCVELVPLFRHHGVDGAVLRLLDVDTLAEVSVSRLTALVLLRARDKLLSS